MRKCASKTIFFSTTKDFAHEATGRKYLSKKQSTCSDDCYLIILAACTSICDKLLATVRNNALVKNI